MQVHRLGLNRYLLCINSYTGSPLGGKLSRRKIFRQYYWLIELLPRKNVEPRIVGIRSTFCGSTFFPPSEDLALLPIDITQQIALGGILPRCIAFEHRISIESRFIPPPRHFFVIVYCGPSSSRKISFTFLVNRPFSYSHNECGSNDISSQFVEFSNEHNCDRSSNAALSNLAYKIV